MQLLWDVSDRSTEFCERFVQVGLHTDILKSLNWDTLSLESLNKSDENIKIQFVKAQINTLHNVVRNAESARGAFRQCKPKAVDIIQKFRDVTEYPVCWFSIIYITSHVVCFLPRALAFCWLARCKL